jgi:hypothetical protein
MASKINRKYRSLRVLGILLVAACRFGFSMSAHASNNCPWINEATVSGLLEGQAVGDFNQGAGGQPSTCSFVRKTAGGTRMLTVTVETIPDAHARVMNIVKDCVQPPEVLPAIGNEASMCATEHGKDALSSRVVGRVRDQVFTIAIGTTGKGDAKIGMADLKMRIAIAAEQVSGNLF